MLFLLFDLDGDRYALDSTGIVEVLALEPTKSIPGAPAWVAGMFERHGEAVPVIDVPQLALGRPAHRLRSTRLVLVHYRAGSAGNGGGNGGEGGSAGETRQAGNAPAHDGNGAPTHRLGLIVERATQTRRIGREQFADSGIATPHARWLGPVASDDEGLVQWVEVQQMLTDEVKALLFPRELNHP